MSSYIAREVLAKAIAELRAERDKVQKDAAAAHHKHQRSLARLNELDVEIESVESALNALGGPIPEEVSA